MISHILSVVPHGYEGRLVEVEGDSSEGLPCFNIVGMANKTVQESSERVRSAIRSSNLSFPRNKIIINLAPAELTKDGTYLDLPIALSILILSGQLLEKDLASSAFVGELSLDGHLRPIRGAINIAEAAKQAGIKNLFLPVENVIQASLISGIKIFPVTTLVELVLYLKHQSQLSAITPVVKNTKTEARSSLFDQIRGQPLAKRAMIIAVAGHHNILLSGPPGAGKTLLARAAIELLPSLSTAEQLSVSKLHDIAGISTKIVTSRPFRTPHHTSTLPALIGGGPRAKPGEVSLAHLGVLFLDELPEYPRAFLESLRQPLEDKSITVTRTNEKYTYPADFMLIATMNPCPCGFFGDPSNKCTCSAYEIHRYQDKLSGPLMDRIDLRIEVDAVPTTDLIREVTPQASPLSLSTAKQSVAKALKAQSLRYGKPALFNSSLSSAQISQYLKLSTPVKSLLEAACKKLSLSARSYFKIIKIARTIADLEESTEITPAHIAEALNFR